MSALASTFNTLLQSGVLGAVLVWFMLRLEGILKANTEAQLKVALILQRVCEKLDIPPEA